jgi:multiple sugar transport system substrate-binding protein
MWAGAEGKVVQDLIDEFNKSQNVVEAKGLSVPDSQKITVAISSGNGPDVADGFGSDMASYASKGILLDLDSYIAKDNYDTSDFLPMTLESCKYNGKLFALPLNFMNTMLFYNKTLFTEAGLSAPPKTDKELLADAIKLTKVNSDKTIKVLGFPDYPSAASGLIGSAYSFGGKFISDDGKTLTPNNSGALLFLNILVQYRTEFGVDNVLKFQGGGKYLEPTDPFLLGTQAMRIDGIWLGSFMKRVDNKVEYGVVPLPYPDGRPELAGSTLCSTSTFYITNNSKNKDGAWTFMKWLFDSKQLTKFMSGLGNLTSRKSALSDPVFNTVPNAKAFIDYALLNKMGIFPTIAAQSQYSKIIGDQAELAANLKITPEQALKAADDQSKSLLLLQ